MIKRKKGILIHIKFILFTRSSFIRENDKFNSQLKVFVHVLLIIALTSSTILPYFLAISIVHICYTHGLRFFLVIMGVCSSLVLLSPLMFTRKNKDLTRIYFSYFFTRNQVLAFVD